MEKKNYTWIVRNLILAAAAVGAFMLLCWYALAFITGHGKELEVPDFSNMSVDAARIEAERCHMRVQVSDSVYVRRMARGAVYSQNPKAGSKVKKGRRILLTINSVTPKKVQMPNLVGYSMRQAKAELSSRGLMLGKLIYVEDMATNNVLRQIYRNREIEPGKPIETGAMIDLVVGLNSDDNTTYIPAVGGMKFLRARDALLDNSINVGKLVFDKEIRSYADSLDAVVTIQNPTPSDMPVPMGTEVQLHLSSPGK